MDDNTHYKSISKKEKGSMVEIRSYDNYIEYLKVFGKRKECYEIKLVESEDNGSEMALHYIKGKLQMPEKEKVETKSSKEPMDLFETLKKFSKAAPSRGNNPVQLLFDTMLGEDIFKPKVSVLKGGKE